MKQIHVVNPMWNAYGGSEWHAASLFEMLAPHTEVSLWSEEKIDRGFLGRFPIRSITAKSFPIGGTIIFVGCYFKIGPWIKAARPQRVLLIYNFVQPERLETVLEALRHVPNLPPTEVVFVSDYLRRMTPGAVGEVKHSPIDLALFEPAQQTGGPFTIGKHTRDDLGKHHPEDLRLYRELAKHGVRMRVMGGACLVEDVAERAKLAAIGVELLAAGTEAPDEFLRTLDVFYYRNHPVLKEAWGRSIFEAMATGLPIVAAADGGYAEAIRSGEDGFLVSSTVEARTALEKLKSDQSLRSRMGISALSAVRKLYGSESVAESIGFYTK